jgi:AcrR family transcriptional regulator
MMDVILLNETLPMNKPLSRKEISHDRIVDAAARAIRRSGYAGTGVADIMKEAGMTHGGFYAHFESRDALLAEAVERAGRETAAKVEEWARTRREGSAFRSLVEGYLSDGHLASTESGCVVAALCSEMPRQAPEVRDASAVRVRALIERTRKALPEGSRAADAAVVASTLVGALQLARSVGDERQGRAVLKAARDSLLAQYDTSH